MESVGVCGRPTHSVPCDGPYADALRGRLRALHACLDALQQQRRPRTGGDGNESVTVSSITNSAVEVEAGAQQQPSPSPLRRQQPRPADAARRAARVYSRLLAAIALAEAACAAALVEKAHLTDDIHKARSDSHPTAAAAAVGGRRTVHAVRRLDAENDALRDRADALASQLAALRRRHQPHSRGQCRRPPPSPTTTTTAAADGQGGSGPMAGVSDGEGGGTASAAKALAAERQRQRQLHEKLTAALARHRGRRTALSFVAELNAAAPAATSNRNR